MPVWLLHQNGDKGFSLHCLVSLSVRKVVKVSREFSRQKIVEKVLKEWKWKSERKESSLEGLFEYTKYKANEKAKTVVYLRKRKRKAHQSLT